MPIFTGDEDVVFNNTSKTVTKTVGRGRNKRTVVLPAPGSTLRNTFDTFTDTTGTEVGLFDAINEQEKQIVATEPSKQSNLDKLAKMVPNVVGNTFFEAAKMVPTVFGETIEGIGYLHDKFIRGMSAEEEANHDWHKHTNFANEFINGYKEKFDNYFNVERANPDSTFDITDLAWWNDAINGAASSVPYMLIPKILKTTAKAAGAPVALASSFVNNNRAPINSIMGNWYKNVMTKIANGVNHIPRVNVNGEQVRNVISSGVSGIASRIIESGQNAGEVYNEIYDNVLNELNHYTDEEIQNIYIKNPELNGKSKEEIATYLAGDASGEAFGNNFLALATLDVFQASRLNSLMNPFNVKARNAAKLNRQAIANRGGNGHTSFLTRVGDGLAKGFDKIGKAASNLQFSEGLEESISYIGSEMAKDYAYKKINENHRERSMLDYLDDDKMWETFAFGAMGGMAMQGVANAVQWNKRRALKKQLRESGMTEDFIDQYFSEKEDVREREIRDRERVMLDAENKLALVNGVNGVAYNPYRPKLDSTGNIIRNANGGIEYEQLDPKAEQDVKQQIVREAAVEMALNASRVGNYDLLREYIKAIDYKAMGEAINQNNVDFNSDEAVKYAEDTRATMLNAMEEARSSYEKRVAQIEAIAGVENSYIADIYARTLVGRDLAERGIYEAHSRADETIERLLSDLELDEDEAISFREDVDKAKKFSKAVNLRDLLIELNREKQRLYDAQHKHSQTGLEYYNSASKNIDTLIDDIKSNLKETLNDLDPNNKDNNDKSVDDLDTSNDNYIEDHYANSYVKMYNENRAIYDALNQYGYTYANREYISRSKPKNAKEFKREFEHLTAKFNHKIDASYRASVERVAEYIKSVADDNDIDEETVLNNLLHLGMDGMLYKAGNKSQYSNQDLIFDHERIEYGNESTKQYADLLKAKVKELTDKRKRASAANNTGGQSVSTNQQQIQSGNNGQAQDNQRVDTQAQNADDGNGNSSPSTGLQSPAILTSASQNVPVPTAPNLSPPVVGDDTTDDSDNEVQSQNNGEILNDDSEPISTPTLSAEAIDVEEERLLSMQREMAGRSYDSEEIRIEADSAFSIAVTTYFTRRNKIQKFIDEYNAADDKDAVLNSIYEQMVNDLQQSFESYFSFNNGNEVFQNIFKAKLAKHLEREVKRQSNKNQALADFAVLIYTKLDEGENLTSSINGFNPEDRAIIEDFIKGMIINDDNRTDVEARLQKIADTIAYNNDRGDGKRKRVMRYRVSAVDIITNLVKNGDIGYDEAIRIYNTLKRYHNNKNNNLFNITDIAEVEKAYTKNPESFFIALNETYNKRKVETEHNVRFNLNGRNTNKDANLTKGQEVFVTVTTGHTNNKRHIYSLNNLGERTGSGYSTTTENGTTNWQGMRNKPVSLSIKDANGVEVGMLGSIEMSEDGTRKRIYGLTLGFHWTITQGINDSLSTNYDRFFADLMGFEENETLAVGNGRTIEFDVEEREAILTIAGINKELNSEYYNESLKRFYDYYFVKHKDASSVIKTLIENGRVKAANRGDSEFVYRNESESNDNEKQVLEVLESLFDDIGSVVNFYGSNQSQDGKVTPDNPVESYAEWVSKMNFNFTQTEKLQQQAVANIPSKSGEDIIVDVATGDHTRYGIRVKVDTLQDNSSASVETVKTIDGGIEDANIFIATDTHNAKNGDTILSNDKKFAAGTAFIVKGDETIIINNSNPISGELEQKLRDYLTEVLTELQQGASVESVANKFNTIFSAAGTTDGTNNIPMFKNVYVSVKDGKMFFMYNKQNSNPVGENNAKSEPILLFSYGPDKLGNGSTRNVFRYNSESKSNMSKEDIRRGFINEEFTSGVIQAIVDTVMPNIRLNITDAYTKGKSVKYGNDNVSFAPDGVTVFGRKYTSYGEFLNEAGGITFSKYKSSDVQSSNVGSLSYASFRVETVTHTDDAVTTTTKSMLANLKYENGEAIVKTDDIFRSEGSGKIIEEIRKAERESGVKILDDEVRVYNPRVKRFNSYAGAYGYYDTNADKIYLRAAIKQDDRSEQVRTIFHETIHKHIAREFADKPEQRDKLFAETESLFNELVKNLGSIPDAKLRNTAINVANKINELYKEGHPNRAEEILVEVLTNPSLREAANLIQIDSDTKLVESKSLLDKFIEILMQVLGVDVKEKSILAKQIQLINKAINGGSGNAIVAETTPSNSNPDNDVIGATNDIFGTAQRQELTFEDDTIEQLETLLTEPDQQSSNDVGQNDIDINSIVESLDLSDTAVDGGIDENLSDDIGEDIDDLSDLQFSKIGINPNETIDEIKLANNDAIDGRLSFGVNHYRSMQDFVTGNTNAQRASLASLLAQGAVKFSCR